MGDEKNKEAQIDLNPRSKIWIESNGEVVFGGGRVALLLAIAETGSIRQAANKLNMSYRAAWGKIKATEERLGVVLLERHTGGSKSGAQLTPEAKKLADLFRQFKSASVEAVDKLFIEYFKEFLK